MSFARVASAERVRLPSERGAVLITPAGKTASFALRELLASRELLLFLVWRDLKIRYSQTFLGIAWVMLQPLVSLTLFTIIFGRLAGMPSDGLPYPAFVISALVIWAFFINGTLNASGSLVTNAQLVSKTYFARLAIPSAIILSNLIDLAVSFVLMLVVLFWYDVELSWRLLLLPFLTAVAFLAACGAGFFLAAINVIYRDVKYIVPFLAQAWFFASPVVYPISLFPEEVHWLLQINPMAGVIEGFRWAAGAANEPLQAIVLSTVSALVVFIAGVLTFCRMESRFADVI